MTARLWSRPAANGTSTGGPNGQSAVEHFTRHGLADPEAQEKIRQRSNYYPGLVPDVPARFHRIMHGDSIVIGGREWRVIVGYGHAPEHASLYFDTLQVLISGDRKSVVSGKSGSVRVYLGGRRVIKKQTKRKSDKSAI